MADAANMTPTEKRPATASASLWMGAVLACARSTRRSMSPMAVPLPTLLTQTLILPSTFIVPAVTPLPGSKRHILAFFIVFMCGRRYLCDGVSENTSEVGGGRCLPGIFETGIGSPVSAASMADDIPDTTTPSTGMQSPGRTVRMSPSTRASVGTSLHAPVLPISSFALSGMSFCVKCKKQDGTRGVGVRRTLQYDNLAQWVTCKAAKSDEAASFARSSSDLPSSTQPRSIAGSSKNVGQPSDGMHIAKLLMAKLAHAPRATKLFMSGRLCSIDCQPLVTISRPGPATRTISAHGTTAARSTLRVPAADDAVFERQGW